MSALVAPVVSAHGRCHCGCGERTKIAKRSDPRWGVVKGEPRRFVLGHGNRLHPRGWVAEDRGHDTPCHIWQGAKDRHGYGNLRRGGRGVLAHRQAWIDANGPIPDGLNVLHRCDVPSCVNEAHLFLGTQADNMRDMAVKERQGAMKLTAREVLAMRATVGVSDTELARRYGVARSTVARARSGRTWTHLPDGRYEVPA